MKRIVYSFFIFSLLLFSCKSTKDSISPTNQLTDKNVSSTGSFIVYKTSKDYSNLVPVIMNDKKTIIISYPAPTDIFYSNKLARPTELKNGYLLDNRGISKNVVFLKYTYEEYSKLTQAPSLKELILNIADKYPLTEMIYCGPKNQYKNPVNDMNALIDKGFPGCKREEIIPMNTTFE